MVAVKKKRRRTKKNARLKASVASGGGLSGYHHTTNGSVNDAADNAKNNQNNAIYKSNLQVKRDFDNKTNEIRRTNNILHSVGRAVNTAASVAATIHSDSREGWRRFANPNLVTPYINLGFDTLGVYNSITAPRPPVYQDYID